VAVAGIGLVAWLLSLPRPDGASAPRTGAVSRPPAAAPAPSDSQQPAGGALPVLQPGEAGRLRIDFDHPLQRGTLRVFVDDELALEQRLAGQRRTKALVFQLHEGSFREELEVQPGLHEVRVEVTWDDNLKRERIVGNFRPGATRRLEASLGRIRRDLSLEWK
jgi:hypothetical protein